MKEGKKIMNYINQNILKIGIIEKANKEKSYILSIISKIDLPSASSITT